MIAISFENIESILDKHTIEKVELELYFEQMLSEVSDDKSTELSIRLYRSLTAWDENAATWNKATSSTNWKNGAGDYNKYQFRDVWQDGVTSNVWHKFDITTFKNINPKTYEVTWPSPIEEMVDNPDENFGFLLYAKTMPEFLYTSCQGDNPEHYPRLRVTVDGPVGVKDKKNIVQLSNVVNNKHAKQIAFVSVIKGDISVNLFSSKGTSLPVKLIQNGRNVLFSYKNLPQGVYLINYHNKVTKQNEVVRFVNY